MKDKEQINLEKLWSLLILDISELTIEQIEEILAAKKQLREELFNHYSCFPSEWERALRARKRKSELSKLSTEELKKMIEEVARFLASLSDADEDDLCDSAFESPPSDSDEHIIHEILQERAATSKKHTKTNR